MAFRRRKTIGYTFVAIMLGAVLAVILLPSKYESQTSILVHRERVDPPLSAEQTGTLQQMAPALTEEDINSEVGLLQSQDLLEKVVIACGLEDRMHPSILSTVFQMRKQTPEERRAAAVDKLRRDLRIEPIKKSFLISVSYASPDPQLAANVLNTLGNDYLEKHAAVRRPAGTQKFFEVEVDRYRQQLTDAQNSLADFNRKEGLVTAQTEKDAAVPKLAEFEFNMRQTQAAIPQAEEHVHN
ncbi:MAG TPA: Wzz/FepE/Etk N-terminal domain-containing protein [Candidatus Acidoferrum sp.]|nr:Wzz/FepE/Etk N-terminal domain-containing protein [Candidatus Acidoferrum sp.]